MAHLVHKISDAHRYVTELPVLVQRCAHHRSTCRMERQLAPSRKNYDRYLVLKLYLAPKDRVSRSILEKQSPRGRVFEEVAYVAQPLAILRREFGKEARYAEGAVSSRQGRGKIHARCHNRFLFRVNISLVPRAVAPRTAEQRQVRKKHRDPGCNPNENRW